MPNRGSPLVANHGAPNGALVLIGADQPLVHVAHAERPNNRGANHIAPLGNMAGLDPAQRGQGARQAADQGAIVVEPGLLDFGARANLAPQIHDDAVDNLDKFVFSAEHDGRGQDV